MTGLIQIISMAAAISATGVADARRMPEWEMAQAAQPLQIPQAATPGSPQPPAATAPAAPQAPAAPDAQTETPPAPDAAPGAEPDTQPQTDQGPAPGNDQPDAGNDEGSSPDNLSLGEIPQIETMELTPDIARRALDSYIVTKDKYANSDLEQYENLQDFVDQTEDGKKFEADVKAAGFANVNDWNLAVTTLGVMYGSVVDDQTADLKQQISEVEADTELAQDMKDRMVKALKAMIPSENNKKIIEDMMADPVYGPKLKQLDIEEE